MFFYLINNYLICYKKEQLSEGHKLAEEIFDFDQYLSLVNEQNKPFMTEFCKTQGFHNFIERSCRVEKEQTDLFFFNEGIRLCSERGDKDLTMQMKIIANRLLNNSKDVSFNNKALAYYILN